jgi:AAA+ superfamily predicted ATPase
MSAKAKSAPPAKALTKAQAFMLELRAQVAAGFPVVWIVTHEEARARAIVAKAFGAAKVKTWTATHGIEGDPATRAPVAAVQRAAREAGVHVFCDLHPHLADAELVRALRDYCVGGRAAESVFVVIGAVPAVPLEIDRDVALLDLPLPDAPELLAVLDAELARDKAPPAWDKDAFVRAALGLTRGEAERAFRLARAAADAGAALQRVVAEKRRVLRRSATLELVDSDVTIDQVGGLDVLKAWLKSRVLAFDREAKDFGLEEPRGMLTCGVQGCGKSLVSKAAARVLGLPLVRLDFADVFASASPEGAMREAMRVVEAVAPVVLWVDEVEKGLGGDSPDGRQVRVFGAFLTWLQERRATVFVAATANEVDRLPPELARRGRFDEIFFVDLPSAKEREEILALHLQARGRDATKIDLVDLAKDLEQFSGAELEVVVTGALFRAYAQKRDITLADLRGAAREVVPLAVLYEEKIQALRTWGKARARRASADRRTLELFGS